MLLLFKQQIQELFDYGKEEFFQKNVMYIPLAGGGGYSWKFFVGVCRQVLQILTQFQTKKCNFQTRPLKSIPLLTVFRPGR